MAEYAAAHDAYLHYDNFSWQVGAVIVVGVFVFWGLLIDKQPDAGVLLVANLLISLFMSIWLLYTEHNRQFYLFKIHRLHELEQKLGMSQHRRFKHWGEPNHLFISWTTLVDTTLMMQCLPLFPLEGQHSMP